MIPRYSRPEMAEIWSDESRFKTWLEIELLALEKMADLGIAPKEAAEESRRKAKFNPLRIDEIEKEVKHDVIAFLTNVNESIGPASRFLHKGMTSSDLVDTALGVLFKRAGALILSALDELIELSLKRANEFKYTPCIGRSHGIHAEPTTFGLKLLGWHAELKRDRARILDAVKGVSVGKLSGAVGTFASLPPEVEEFVASKLGLESETVATQVVARDRHAAFFCALAVLAGSIERFSVEIRHLQRTEVREAEEEFTSGQKGSSAMPHKRNPILSENLTGLSRLVRGYALTSLENIALWHERDISHSSVERVIAPDACLIVHFMVHRFTGVLRGLKVYPERMKENLERSRGLYVSGSLLVALVDAGMTREEAYKSVQDHALAAWDSEPGLKDRVLKDKKITSLLPKETIEGLFSMDRYYRSIDFLFKRASA